MEKSGGSIYIFTLEIEKQVPGYNLIGEHECRLDDKSRIILPIGLKKQIKPEAQDKFVLNRGFEGCLVLYPWDVWQQVSGSVNSLNMFIQENRRFARAFNNGATEIPLDSQNRLLMPRHLLEHAGIEREIVLFAYADRIEVWDKKTYRELISKEPEDFSELAEKVMVKQARKDEGDGLS